MHVLAMLRDAERRAVPEARRPLWPVVESRCVVLHTCLQAHGLRPAPRQATDEAAAPSD